MATRYLPQCGEYALRAMAHLAGAGGDAKASRDIAAATGVPPNYIQKILAQLTRAGLLSAQRGTKGGYVLTKRPDSISLHEIFVAVSAEVERITACPLGRPEHTHLCPLHRRLDDAYSLIEAVFKTTTLASICESPGQGSCAALQALRVASTTRE